VNVVFSPAAERDLSDLFAYISNNLHNPIAVHNTAEKILRLSYKLVDFPQMGASLATVDKRIDTYCYLIASNYLIVYRIKERGVLIVRILYARSDYVRLLQG
jgi:toxin ParE1/3/4